MRRFTLILIGVLAIVSMALVGGGYFALRALSNSMFPSRTTDVTLYTNILSQWQHSGLVNQFPPTIPTHASNVRLSFFPGYLQGGAHFQVRMTLPASDIAGIASQMKQSTSHQYQGGSRYHHYNKDPTNNLPTATFHTFDNPPQPYAFPDHYTLDVLHAQKRGGGSWNHGETSGVAVSELTNEVIYWAELW